MESLTFAQQLDELGRLAASLVTVISKNKGPMTINDALLAASNEARVPASFMKYGLSYAESENMVTVNDYDGLVSTRQLVSA